MLSKKKYIFVKFCRLNIAEEKNLNLNL
jgi:hypothetical protein